MSSVDLEHNDYVLISHLVEAALVNQKAVGRAIESVNRSANNLEKHTSSISSTIAREVKAAVSTSIETMLSKTADAVAKDVLLKFVGATEAAEKARGEFERIARFAILKVALIAMAVSVVIGARHGFVTRFLVDRFDQVTALDLEKPSFQMERVTPVKGNVTQLDFPDSSFDCVFCTEVLEHVPGVEAAAREIARVARHEVIVGVPYRQDTRVGRMTCSRCGKINPPYGHVNTFDEDRLASLFAGLSIVTTRFVSQTRERTNALSAKLLDAAGNRYGTYDQEEPCIYCGRKLEAPASLSLAQRIAGACGVRLYELQKRFNQPRPNWIHMLFQKLSQR